MVGELSARVSVLKSVSFFRVVVKGTDMQGVRKSRWLIANIVTHMRISPPDFVRAGAGCQALPLLRKHAEQTSSDLHHRTVCSLCVALDYCRRFVSTEHGMSEMLTWTELPVFAVARLQRNAVDTNTVCCPEWPRCVWSHCCLKRASRLTASKPHS